MPKIIKNKKSSNNLIGLQKNLTKIHNYKFLGDISKEYCFSKAGIKVILGPVGSGKSVLNIYCLFLNMLFQQPDENNIRRTKFAVIRNTYDQLENTCLASVMEWLPETEGYISKCGKSPVKYLFDFPLEDGTKVNSEWEFLALDAPDSLNKLYSRELTAAWISECKFVSKSVFHGLIARIGRFPPVKYDNMDIEEENRKVIYGPTYPCIYAETNMCSEDHWLYHYYYDGWFKGNSEYFKANNIHDISQVPDKFAWKFFRQPSALDSNSETNMPQEYYARMLMQYGPNSNWAKVHIYAEFGSVTEGKSIYEEDWNESIHVKEGLVYKEGAPVYIGIDFGVQSTAAIICQVIDQKWQVLQELTSSQRELQSGLLSKFLPRLKQTLEIMGIKKIFLYADPSGQSKHTSGSSNFDICREHGFEPLPAPSNILQARIGCVSNMLVGLHKGEPLLVVDRLNCPILYEGFQGGYRYSERNLSDEPKPVKDQYSHIHDALQYAILGGRGYGTYLSKADQFNKEELTFTNNPDPFKYW